MENQGKQFFIDQASLPFDGGFTSKRERLPRLEIQLRTINENINKLRQKIEEFKTQDPDGLNSLINKYVAEKNNPNPEGKANMLSDALDVLGNLADPVGFLTEEMIKKHLGAGASEFIKITDLLSLPVKSGIEYGDLIDFYHTIETEKPRQNLAVEKARNNIVPFERRLEELRNNSATTNQQRLAALRQA